MIFLQAFAILIFLEIAAFVAVGSLIGFFPMIGLCLLSAVTGGLIVQHQGFDALQKAKLSLDKGLLPMDHLFDGLCILIAGSLLIMPGFVGDLLGFALLVPALRQKLRVLISRKYGKNTGSFDPDTGIIEGDFIRVRDDPDLLRSRPLD